MGLSGTVWLRSCLPDCSRTAYHPGRARALMFEYDGGVSYEGRDVYSREPSRGLARGRWVLLHITIVPWKRAPGLGFKSLFISCARSTFRTLGNDSKYTGCGNTSPELRLQNPWFLLF